MELKVIRTARVKENGDICEFVVESLKNAEKSFEKHSEAEIFGGSVIVISAKIISILEGNLVNLSKITFEELVKKEADSIIRTVNSGSTGMEKCFLTRKNGILIPNAGVDKSNVPEGFAIPWPKDPQKTAETLRRTLMEEFGIENLGVLIADSRVTPGRRGTTGVAIAWSGFVGVADERGMEDLFGKPLQITQRAIADNLATAALCIMGEAAECTPIVVIENAPVTFTDAETDPSEGVMGKKEDLF